MSNRQDAAWKNLSFYRGYLPPTDRERVKEYVLLSLGDDPSKREGSQDAAPIPLARSNDYTPLQLDTLLRGESSWMGAKSQSDTDSGTPLTQSAKSPKVGAGFNGGGVIGDVGHIRRPDGKRFFMIKKASLSQIPHFKSFLLKVKKCLDICTCSSTTTCTPECSNVHVDLANPELIELAFEGMESIIVNRGSQLPSLAVKLGDIERTAGALFCCGLVRHGITQAVQGTQCRFGDRCRYGNRCLFIHMKPHATEEQAPLVVMTQADTMIGVACPFLQKSHPNFLDKLKEMGLETVSDVQILSNMAFDSLVSRGPPEEHILWMQVHTIRELKERATPLAFALTMFPGVSEDRVIEVLTTYRIDTIDQILQMRPRTFYGIKMPIRILDACERIRQRYEPDRDAYHTIDLVKLPHTSFYVIAAKATLEFRHHNAHKSWRKQDATRPIVTSLITYVDDANCMCHAHGTLSANQTPALLPNGMQGRSSIGSPSRTGGSTQSDGPEQHPESSWCRCPRKWELAVNYELSTPSGSRCSEQNCLGKLASMGLATSNIREIFVHGDMHNNEDPNPLFPCGVCENMLRRITNDVQKKGGGEVILYMFDQVRDAKKLVVIPVQEISHREGSNFKRFIQEDLRGDDDEQEKFTGSLTA